MVDVCKAQNSRVRVHKLALVTLLLITVAHAQTAATQASSVAASCKASPAAALAAVKTKSPGRGAKDPSAALLQAQIVILRQRHAAVY